MSICLAVFAGISAVLGAMATSDAVALTAMVFTLVLLAGAMLASWRLHRQLLASLACNQQLVSTHAEREKQWTHYLEGLMGEVHAATVRLLEVRLPAAWAGEPVEGQTWEREELAARFDVMFDQAVTAAQAVRAEWEQQAESLRLVVVALMQRATAAAHRVAAAADYLAQQPGTPAWIAEHLMQIMHEAAQQARHAQSPLVLCGERPGQSWQVPVPLSEMVQAACARISDYTRLSSVGDPDLAAKPAAAEPLIHLLAELLANAAQCSPPTAPVRVHVDVVQSGATITIDDSGVGMTDHKLQEAREVASGRRPVGLTELGEIPQTGLAVVGTVARNLGLTLDLRPSAYGGVQAIVLIPAALLERVQPAGSMPSSASSPAGPHTTASGLPVRRRQEPAPDPKPGPDPGSGAVGGPWTADPEAAGNWMSRLLDPACDPDLRDGADRD